MSHLKRILGAGEQGEERSGGVIVNAGVPNRWDGDGGDRTKKQARDERGEGDG